VEEDVDVLGLSFLSGDHMVLMPKVMSGLKKMKVENVLTIVGGIILKRQIPKLLKLGVHKVFLPGTDPQEIVQYIRENVNTNG
jgi:methylmalonyl-CoA mutase C-terminal domain/subunit